MKRTILIQNRKSLELGHKFGKLTVIGFPFRAKTNVAKTWVVCRCECGQADVFQLNHLRMGKIVSCGCVRKSWLGVASTKHGMCRSVEYSIWCAMISRCYNVNSTGHDRYGGRGITVCDRWRHSFESFYADMGPRPSKRYSIDRIDNDGNYEPGNCRWATAKEQSNNQRRSRFLTHDGKRLTVTQWAEEIGMIKGTLENRLKLGWSTEDALTRPVRRVQSRPKRQSV